MVIKRNINTERVQFYFQHADKLNAHDTKTKTIKYYPWILQYLDVLTLTTSNKILVEMIIKQYKEQRKDATHISDTSLGTAIAVHGFMAIIIRGDKANLHSGSGNLPAHCTVWNHNWILYKRKDTRVTTCSYNVRCVYN